MEIAIRSRPEMRPSINASLCSVSKVTTFGKRDKHSCNAPAIIILSIALIIDNSLSTLQASTNRIFAL